MIISGNLFLSMQSHQKNRPATYISYVALSNPLSIFSKLTNGFCLLPLFIVHILHDNQNNIYNHLFEIDY